MANNENEDFEEIVISFTDENGNEVLYMQEMIIPVNGQDFALLVGIDDNNADGVRTFINEDGQEEEDVVIAKIVKDENGEDEYIEPSEEEYEAVDKAYNAMMDEIEANEK